MSAQTNPQVHELHSIFKKKYIPVNTALRIAQQAGMRSNKSRPI